MQADGRHGEARSAFRAVQRQSLAGEEPAGAPGWEVERQGDRRTNRLFPLRGRALAVVQVQDYLPALPERAKANARRSLNGDDRRRVAGGQHREYARQWRQGGPRLGAAHRNRLKVVSQGHGVPAGGIHALEAQVVHVEGGALLAGAE